MNEFIKEANNEDKNKYNSESCAFAILNSKGNENPTNGDGLNIT